MRTHAVRAGRLRAVHAQQPERVHGLLQQQARPAGTDPRRRQRWHAARVPRRQLPGRRHLRRGHRPGSVGLRPARHGSEAAALRAEREPQHPARRLSLGPRHLEGRLRLQLRGPAEAVRRVPHRRHRRRARGRPALHRHRRHRYHVEPEVPMDLAAAGQQLRSRGRRKLERHHAESAAGRPDPHPGQLRPRHHYREQHAGESQRTLGSDGRGRIRSELDPGPLRVRPGCLGRNAPLQVQPVRHQQLERSTLQPGLGPLADLDDRLQLRQLLRHGGGGRHGRPALDHRHAQPRHHRGRSGHQLVRGPHLPAVQERRHLAAGPVHHHGGRARLRRFEGRRARLPRVGRPRPDQGPRHRLRRRWHLRPGQPARLHPQQLHCGREPGHLPDRLGRHRRIADRPLEVHRQRNLADHEHVHLRLEHQYRGRLQRPDAGQHPVPGFLWFDRDGRPQRRRHDDLQQAQLRLRRRERRGRGVPRHQWQTHRSAGSRLHLADDHQHAFLLDQVVRSAELYEPAAHDHRGQPDDVQPAYPDGYRPDRRQRRCRDGLDCRWVVRAAYARPEREDGDRSAAPRRVHRLEHRGAEHPLLGRPAGRRLDLQRRRGSGRYRLPVPSKRRYRHDPVRSVRIANAARDLAIPAALGDGHAPAADPGRLAQRPDRPGGV